jgi:hypothetical protein
MQLLYAGDRYSCAKAAVENINDTAIENPSANFFMVKLLFETDR